MPHSTLTSKPNKKKLQEKNTQSAPNDKNEIGIHIGCVASWSSPQDCESILKGLRACMDLGYHLFMMAQGDSATLEVLMELQEDYPAQCQILEENDKNCEWVLRHSHLLLIPHTPSRNEIQVAQTNKLVPLTLPNKYLENFNPSKEKGQAFLFETGSEWDFVRSVIRAAENKQFGYDWGNLKKALGKVSL